MDSFEINKYVGAILGTALFLVVIGLVTDALFEVEDAGEATLAAATADAPAATAGKATADATDADVAALLAAADPEAGAKLFRKCAACHSIDEGGAKKIGPNLWDIVGKAMASGDYDYSPSLADLGGEWDYESLDAFISKPKAFAPGTKMTFAGLTKASDRANLIAFLRLQSAAPKPLP